MDKYGKMIAPGVIRFERDLPGPIEKVWTYLTDSGKRSQWLASGDMELTKGGTVDLCFKHEGLSPVQEEVPEKYKAMESGHHFAGRVLEINAPYSLSITWEGGSEVTFELQPNGERVLLVLTHRKLDTRTAQLSVAGGWHTHLEILIARLEGKAPEGFWKMHSKLEAEYAALI